MQTTGRLFEESGPKILRTLWLAGIVFSLIHLSACGSGGENEMADVADHGKKLRPEIIEGFELLREKNYEQAMSTVFALIAKDPDDAEAMSVMSLIYVHQERMDAASNLAKRSLKIDPDQSLPYNVLARVNFQISQFEKALDLARKALIINPQSFRAYKVIGEIYIRKGLIKDALAVLREAMKLEANDPEILNLLGSAYIKDKQFKQALPVLQKAEKIDPEFPGVHLNLAIVFSQSGEGPNAMKHIDRAEYLYTQEENAPWMAKTRDMRRVIAKKFKMRPEDIS